MRIELHPDAEDELLRAAEWYEERGAGLGEDLLREIERCLDLLREAPRAWPRWPKSADLDPPIRRGLTGRFPFAIAYRVFEDRISVLAIAHTSRRPLYWIDRSGGR